MKLSSIELEERFNDYLNSVYGEFRIGHNVFSADTILYALDEMSYEQQYSDWLYENGYKEI